MRKQRMDMRKVWRVVRYRMWPDDMLLDLRAKNCISREIGRQLKEMGK